MAKDTSAWGKATAKARYGGAGSAGMSVSDKLQKPQDPEDKHGPGYDNDTSGWVKGDGKPYPHFDRGHRGK